MSMDSKTFPPEKENSVGDEIFERENIFLFFPNLIGDRILLKLVVILFPTHLQGYARLILATFSLYYMPLHPRTCSLLYSASCILDAADGIVARRYNQLTTFGAVLDMITDRCSTACLHVFLATAFPRWAVVFQGFISLDLASHYVHMYAVLAMGSSERSHKQVDPKRNYILYVYYTNKSFLFLLCALNELFFIALYLLSFSTPPPLGVVTTASHSAGGFEMARANKISGNVPFALAVLSCPFMIVKQFINIIQLVTACKWLGEGDAAVRRRDGIAPLKQRYQQKKAL